jgi:glycosyltransferase involved in cell wall biosynthesis
MKIALVHDWLTGLRGGEKCLLSFLQLYPNADVYTLIHVPGTTDPVIDARVRGCSMLQRFPGVKRYYRLLLPLFPSAARSIDLDGYDLVISLSHAAAKNVRVPASTFHISYCFTPMRYIWDQAEFYFGRRAYWLKPLFTRLREWDVEGAQRVNEFVAISRFVAARVRSFYGRRSEVIYPAVETQWVGECGEAFEQHGSSGEQREFLCAGALVPYKRIDAVVEAFRDLPFRLCVAGDGPERRHLEGMAGANVRFTGRVSNPELARLYRDCRALIFPGIEDFGMVPVECMAAGKPVIGPNKGGLRETVVGIPTANQGTRRVVAPSPTGVLFPYRSGIDSAAIASAVQFFSRREGEFSSGACVTRAQDFAPERFFRDWAAFSRRVGVDPGRADRLLAQGEHSLMQAGNVTC